MLLCFDPGKTTGVAQFNMYGELEFIDHLDTEQQIYSWIYSREETKTTVLYEGFARGNTASKDQLMTVELCGFIRGCAMTIDLKCVMQYPTIRLPYEKIAKAMVKAYRGEIKPQTPTHAIAAVAHGIAYMEKEKIEWNKKYWMNLTYN